MRIIVPLVFLHPTLRADCYSTIQRSLAFINASSLSHLFHEYVLLGVCQPGTFPSMLRGGYILQHTALRQDRRNARLFPRRSEANREQQ